MAVAKGGCGDQPGSRTRDLSSAYTNYSEKNMLTENISRLNTRAAASVSFPKEKAQSGFLPASGIQIELLIKIKGCSTRYNVHLRCLPGRDNG
jgi:hypothetical protein